MYFSFFAGRPGRTTFISVALSSAAFAATEPLFELEPVHVIARSGSAPLTVDVDPRAAAQPIPANDGAEILRSIPGFNVIRKGGTDGDPVLRGMAGSRIGILLDGETILGGCGNRMDPPTAYVHPAAYDRVTVLKGPQSVIHGPGLTAGIVQFERIPESYTQAEATARVGLTMGSFGRNDQLLDIRAGTPNVYVNTAATRTESDNYEDGSGQSVHSRYLRWSVHTALGWTPDAHTRVELTGVVSDGEAAYADRMMDGALFERENLGLRFERHHISERIESVEFKLYRNHVDHVMDNYSLRPFSPSMMMPGRSASNPDRETLGGRAQAALRPLDPLKVIIGADHQTNHHRVRSTNNQDIAPYQLQTRERDASFSVTGIFLETIYEPTSDHRVITGLRADRWTATDHRPDLPLGMMARVPNPTRGDKREHVLPAAFIRLEQDFAAATTVYIGLGHAQRFPDYWELFSKEALNSLSAFHMRAEKVTQIDAGVTHRAGSFTTSVSLFANQIDDFILIESEVAKSAAMAAIRKTTVARNINARTFGGEISVAWIPGNGWRADGALAYVYGENRTDKHALAQQPPLEGRFGLSYTSGKWTIGGLARVAAQQNRVALNQGNIVGQDLGPTGGFAVFSLNAAWQATRHAKISIGMDNLFDRTYAEHLSRGGSMAAGFPPPTLRVNEPGRTGWIKLDLSY